VRTNKRYQEFHFLAAAEAAIEAVKSWSQEEDGQKTTTVITGRVGGDTTHLAKIKKMPAN